MRVYYPPQVSLDMLEYLPWWEERLSGYIELKHKHIYTVTRLGKEAIEKSVCDNLVGSAVPKNQVKPVLLRNVSMLWTCHLVEQDRQWYQNAIAFILSR